MMEVNGLPLPGALVQIVLDGQGEWTEWMTKEHVLKEHLDAYRYYFPFSSIQIYDLDTAVKETAEVPGRFEPYEELEPLGEIEFPGFIPDIKDRSKLVVFGTAGGGRPLCLDYRDNLQEPTVVFWDSNGWQRLAPSFAAFSGMIEPYENDEFDRRMDLYG